MPHTGRAAMDGWRKEIALGSPFVSICHQSVGNLLSSRNRRRGGVGFINNNPNYPIVLGGMYGSKHTPPFGYEAKNNIKAIVTRSKMSVEFDEEKKIITIQTPAKNTIVMSDEGKSISVTDQNKNKMVMDSNGIELSSSKNIKLTAKGNIALNAAGKVSIDAKSDVDINGTNVKVTAKVGAKVKGNATAELSASGQTTVKGAMVMIN